MSSGFGLGLGKAKRKGKERERRESRLSGVLCVDVDVLTPVGGWTCVQAKSYCVG